MTPADVHLFYLNISCLWSKKTRELICTAVTVGGGRNKTGIKCFGEKSEQSSRPIFFFKQWGFIQYISRGFMVSSNIFPTETWEREEKKCRKILRRLVPKTLISKLLWMLFSFTSCTKKINTLRFNCDFLYVLNEFPGSPIFIWVFFHFFLRSLRRNQIPLHDLRPPSRISPAVVSRRPDFYLNFGYNKRGRA